MSLPEDASLAVTVKKELRKRMRGLRNTASRESCTERSDRIATRVLAELEAMGATHVALFAAIPERNEVDLERVDRECRALGRSVYYPSIDEARVMKLRLAPDFAAMEEQGLGFREPGPHAPLAERVDAIVVPSLAVDLAGHRLGYGAGFYDRMIPLYAPPAKTLVVAFDYQVLVDLPSLEHDVACNVVITDARLERVHRGA